MPARKKRVRRTPEAIAIAKHEEMILDPVCLFHGLRLSQHECLVCCLCYKDLTPDNIVIQKDGTREDICWDCAWMEVRAILVGAADPDYVLRDLK